MTDFVISEERLKRMLSHPSFTIYEDVKKRPLSDELKKERERVLDEMESFAVSDIPEGYMDDTAKTNGQWVRKIKSLRGEP